MVLLLNEYISARHFGRLTQYKGFDGLQTLIDLKHRFDTSEATPLYQRLKKAMRENIDSHAWEPDDPVPSERDIAERLEISRVTVRKAIDGLVEDGMLVRKRGSGTFVAGRVEKSFATLTSFTEDMAARGRKVRSDWLVREKGSVTPEESLSLSLSPGTAVYRFNRIRFADNVAMALEYSTIPAECLGSGAVVEESLYAALRARNHNPVRALQRLRAVLFSAEQAELLDVPASSAGLLIERIGYNSAGSAVEWTRSYYRGDAYDFVAELNLGK
ncbi:HTH-type transcriptional repressor NagR [Qipengyuania sp. 483]